MEGKGKGKESEDAQAPNEQSMEQILQALRLAQKAKPEKEDKKEDHAFWKTQPVPDFGEEVTEDGAYEADKKPEEVRQNPYPLPDGFEWSEIDITAEPELKELYTLLTMNYVEDDDAMFRFDYSPEFIRWALQPPNWRKLWHVGVRVSSNKKLVAFISAIPADIRIYSHEQLMVEVNFLCVHKKLRSKRLAPVLIKEITRRVHVTGTFQAAYTAGMKLPRPVSTARYFHRSLNPKKLIETGFSHLGRNMTLARMIKLYKLPENPITPGFRQMKESDIPQTFPLLKKYLEKFKFAPIFTEADFKHYFLTRENVVYSYVVEDGQKKEVTDFVSFYSLPSTVINHPVHKTLYVAYCYYYSHSVTPLHDLIRDALIVAKSKGFDVFNCLNLMENNSFIEDLKFGPGDGELQYYLYNWRCKDMTPEGLGLVLL